MHVARGSDTHFYKPFPRQIRLLRVYSPWRDGLWSGAWSTGHTAEWRAPEHAAARQEVAHTLGDGQTFWITFE